MLIMSEESTLEHARATATDPWRMLCSTRHGSATTPICPWPKVVHKTTFKIHGSEKTTKLVASATSGRQRFAFRPRKHRTTLRRWYAFQDHVRTGHWSRLESKGLLLYIAHKPPIQGEHCLYWPPGRITACIAGILSRHFTSS